MVAKRQANQGARANKKAKLDPVSAKIKAVCDALSREDSELKGPESYKQGILAALPLAVGEGASKDERHEYQQLLVNIVKEVLEATVDKFRGSLAAAKEELSAAQLTEASRETAVTEAERTLEEQRKLEQEAHDTLLNSQEALTLAASKTKEATDEVANFDVVQIEKSKEHAEFRSAQETEFEKLKAGTFEDAKEKKALLSSLTLLLKRLELDQGLCSAAQPAFSKAAAERGSFDIMVVDQIQAALTAKIDALQDDLNNGETLKATKATELTQAQEAEAAAQSTLEANQAAVVAAKEKSTELQAALKEAKASLKQQTKIVANIDIKGFYEQSNLENFQEALQALEFLRERSATSPDANEVEAQVEMQKISAMETPAMEEVDVVV